MGILRWDLKNLTERVFKGFPGMMRNKTLLNFVLGRSSSYRTLPFWSIMRGVFEDRH